MSDKYEWKLTVEPRRKGGPGSGYHGHAGRPGQVGGSAPGKGGEQRTSDYAPYETPAEKEMYDWLIKRVPEELLKTVGLHRIHVTPTPQPGHPETGGYTSEGITSIVEGDTKTLLHEVSHVIDLSHFGDKLENIAITLRDSPAMAPIGYRERVAVFLESYYSDPGSRANDWVMEKFPELVAEYESIVEAQIGHS